MTRKRLRFGERAYDLPTLVGQTRLRNPVVASSGTYGYGLEYRRYGDPSRLGAVVVKSLTAEPRLGFAAPRVRPLHEPGSMRNAIGVPNPGVESWARSTLPRMIEQGVAVVASIWGTSADHVVDAARLLSRHEGAIAWEINLSCPNSDYGGLPVSHDAELAAEVCKEVRSLAPDSAAVWAKLSPDAPDTVEVAFACHRAGASAVTVANTQPASDSIIAAEGLLGGGPGGMSGAILRSYVRPLVEKIASTHPLIPLIACGGVLTSEVATDYLELGAAAVQVGTASLYDPRACHKIARGVVALARAGRG